ncbi:MAG TPA: ARMT1-like domain-containing protein [Bacteroidales bacterium]|nr:ARMT1-like domain-containing protein [Bacteroidales bacterium]
MDYRCYNCLVRSFSRLLEKFQPKANNNEILMKEFLSYLSTIDENLNAPYITGYMQEIIKKMIGIDDLYFEEKEFANNMLLAKYQELKKVVSVADCSFTRALRLAIAGNIIDYAANPDFDIMQTIEYVLENDFAVDDSQELMQEIINAKNVLYLGDNAGEIVLDKLFLETIGRRDIVFAVRGKPVINDATIEDAKKVGITNLVHVIDNGSKLPSTVVDECSPEFVKYFNNADLIISKGQGNLEGLINTLDKNIYFLCMVKCNAIGEALGVTKGSFVVMNNKRLNKKHSKAVLEL